MDFKDFLHSSFCELNVGLVLVIFLCMFAWSFVPLFIVEGSNAVFLYFFILCFFLGLFVLNMVFRFFRGLFENKNVVYALFFSVLIFSFGFAYHEQVVFDRDLALRRNIGLEYYNSFAPKSDICYVQKNYLNAFSPADRLELQTQFFENMLSKGYVLRTVSSDYFIFKKSAKNKE